MSDTKISDLPEATALTGAELFLASQSAADVKASLQRLRDELDWVRPADWPAMPASAANTIHILAAVSDHASNLAAMRISVSSGTWSIDWGDGVTNSGIASNTTQEHAYDFSDGDLPAVTSRGYKVAVITITTSGGNITTFNPSLPPTGTTAHTPPWLEMQINAPAVTAFTTIQNQCVPRLCEHINFVATGAVTSLTLSNLTRLEKLSYHSGFLSNLTSLFNSFINCSNLRRLDLSGLSTGITSMSSAFGGCAALTDLTFPTGTLGSSLTDMTNAFSGCTRLRSITLPSGALSNVTAASGAFANCVSLRQMVFPSGALAAATNLSSAFNNCASLRYAEFASGLAAVTNIATLFNGCISLQHIKFGSGGFGSLSSATTNLFNGCAGLARIENCAIPLTFSLQNCRLGAVALDEVYSALPTVSSQTVTVSGNHGTSGDTPSIATGKGWAVTG